MAPTRGRGCKYFVGKPSRPPELSTGQFSLSKPAVGLEPRPTVYKTVALPLSYAGSMQKNSLSPGGIRRSHPIRGPGPLPAVVTRSNPVAIVADYCSLGREGFEPRSREASDLQSDAIDHSATDPISRCADSNRGPTPYHGVALPTELQRHVHSRMKKQYTLAYQIHSRASSG